MAPRRETSATFGQMMPSASGSPLRDCPSHTLRQTHNSHNSHNQHNQHNQHRLPAPSPEIRVRTQHAVAHPLALPNHLSSKTLYEPQNQVYMTASDQMLDCGCRKRAAPSHLLVQLLRERVVLVPLAVHHLLAREPVLRRVRIPPEVALPHLEHPSHAASDWEKAEGGKRAEAHSMASYGFQLQEENQEWKARRASKS